MSISITRNALLLSQEALMKFGALHVPDNTAGSLHNELISTFKIIRKKMDEEMQKFSEVRWNLLLEMGMPIVGPDGVTQYKVPPERELEFQKVIRDYAETLITIDIDQPISINEVFGPTGVNLDIASKAALDWLLV